MNPEVMTPQAIDTELSRIWESLNKLFLNKKNIESYLEREEERNEKFPSKWVEKNIAEQKGKLADISEKIKALNEESRPYNEEYASRRWNRYFLVLNGNGHVHREKNCSTCFPTTQYGWLPVLSGCDEKEAVLEYGEKMCSVCFPDAPSLAKLLGPSRQAQAVAAKKAEREAKKQEKARMLAEKAITNPDGSSLVISGWPIKTVAGAKHELNRQAELLEMDARNRFNVPDKEKKLNYARESMKKIADALAAKLGSPAEEFIEKAQKKAKKIRWA